jgi:DNA-binding winged helix-turn-helix (wHTH) protein/CheY-like chemotaxis protein
MAGPELQSSWCVHLVCSEPTLIERTRYYFKKRLELALSASAELPAGTKADVVVLPAQMLTQIDQWDARSAEGPLPLAERSLALIAYGDVAQMRGAFLMGVFDYLTEPWTPEELMVRLDRLLQRWNRQYDFEWGSLNLRGKVLRLADRRVSLSHQEAAVLRLLLRHRGTVVSREALFYVLWGKPPENPSRVIDVHVSSLNRKLRALVPELEGSRLIVSVRRIGYTIE